MGNAAWDPRGLVIEKGRDYNRLAVLTFADDLDSFTGVGFEGTPRVKPTRRKR